MNNSNLEDSDSSDEDYIPNKKSEEILSEDDSGEDSEGDVLSNEPNSLKGKKRTKSSAKCRKKPKKNDLDNDSSENAESSPLTAESKKKIEEDVWADFIKDTGFQAKGKISQSCENTKTNSLKPIDDRKLEAQKKIVVTEVVNFAGEDITIEKTLPQSTSENKLLKEVPIGKTLKNPIKSTSGGVGGILGQLMKKPKINTLEKSKLDWDRFKREEKLEEELQTFNKGKDGYLEKQDFLRRADLRRFEIEKGIRTIERSKRGNDSM